MRCLFPVLVMLAVVGPAATMRCLAQQPNAQGDGVLLKGFVVESGRVNVVEGEVQLIRRSKSVAALKANQTLESGDTLQSAVSGRAEILLVPGYYLRLDHNTRISILDLSAGNMKLKLWSGSAILEVVSYEFVTVMDRLKRLHEFSYESVSCLTPSAQYLTASGGSYRFDVDAKGNSQLSVLKGFAFVNGSRIDAGKFVSVVGGKTALPAAAKKEDEFDSWSRQRARSLVKANQSLSKAHWYKQVRSDRAYVLIKDPEDASRAKERLTVSADTGVVVLAENALVSGSSASAWRKLESGERLTNGRRVRTAFESRAEIHVYPNCFLFLEGDSEILYRETQGQVTVELINGSAIAILDPNSEAVEPAVLTIVAERVEHRIWEKGNYRVNVMPNAKSELLVYEGTTRIPKKDIPESKKDRAPNNLQEEISLKKLTGDSFDLWSLRRSKLPVIRSFARYFGGGMWYLLESTGEYTFVPARSEFSSPYGGDYSIMFARDTLLEKPRRNPALDPLEPPFRPMRP